METARTDLELRAEMPSEEDIKAKRRIQMPARMCIVTTAAVTSGAVVTGLVLEYYLRKRRRNVIEASPTR
jgi:hypothetical protein